MTASFIEAYQEARSRMDELKIAVRHASHTAIMAVMASGQPVIVTKKIKMGNEHFYPGDELTPDPNLLHRYEVLAKQGYFTTKEQYALAREWNENKNKYEYLEGAFKKWDRAATANQAARARLARAEAELQAAKGELQHTSAQFKQAEAEGMEVFAKLKTN
jgi:hypothetical protein